MYAGFYLLTSLISAIVALTLALILTGLQVRDLEGFEKYNRARWFLAGAFGVFGILGVAEILLGEPSGLETGFPSSAPRSSRGRISCCSWPSSYPWASCCSSCACGRPSPSSVSVSP